MFVKNIIKKATEKLATEVLYKGGLFLLTAILGSCNFNNSSNIEAKEVNKLTNYSYTLSLNKGFLDYKYLVYGEITITASYDNGSFKCYNFKSDEEREFIEKLAKDSLNESIEESLKSTTNTDFKYVVYDKFSNIFTVKAKKAACYENANFKTKNLSNYLERDITRSN